jgi:hypothetical protein
VQAQEFESAKWALGLRMRAGATAARVQRDFDDGRILRTHVMRPTWHFVTPRDIRWMLELTAPRVQRVLASYLRNLELETPLLVRSVARIEQALGQRGALTRAELSDELRRSGITLTGIRLAMTMMYAELQAVVCSGPRRGSQFTYAQLADRAPDAAPLPRDEALATLAHRYFTSHAPATIRDFVWWSGLTTADARRAIDMNRARREVIGDLAYWSVGPPARPSRRHAGRVHLLPIYDEYLVAHRDRVAVPHRPLATRTVSGASGSFQHTVTIDGQVAGTWRVLRASGGVTVTVTPLCRLTPTERRTVAEAVRSYERFLRVPVSLTIGVR